MRSLYTDCMIREHFSKRTNAPQPQLLIVAIVWAIALLCLNDGSQPKWARYLIGIAVMLTVYVAIRFWAYYGKRGAR